MPNPAIHISDLPHWARVALAARCARTVLPVFRRAWPAASAARLAAVERCIWAAEQSARQARIVEDMEEITSDGYQVIGSALMGLYGCPFETDETFPADGELAVLASSAARVAVKAAEAVEHGPAKSANYALEAFSDALEAARSIESEKIEARLAKHLDDAERAATVQAWTDDSPVSPSFFKQPPPTERKWWKFW